MGVCADYFFNDAAVFYLLKSITGKNAVGGDNGYFRGTGIFVCLGSMNEGTSGADHIIINNNGFVFNVGADGGDMGFISRNASFEHKSSLYVEVVRQGFYPFCAAGICTGE